RARFGLGPTPIRLSTPIVVVRRDDRLLGLVVDAAREVLSLPPGAAASPDDLVTGGVIIGIVRHDNRTIPILDIAQLFDATATMELPGSDWTGRAAKESNALG
ncbi:MAG: chemotaxis protein CheW, partial [Actinomycetota bacterium]|nr:chemotaxis protein CheW [Actinomycetota bacterium]